MFNFGRMKSLWNRLFHTKNAVADQAKPVARREENQLRKHMLRVAMGSRPYSERWFDSLIASLLRKDKPYPQVVRTFGESGPMYVHRGHRHAAKRRLRMMRGSSTGRAVGS